MKNKSLLRIWLMGLIALSTPDFCQAGFQPPTAQEIEAVVLDPMQLQDIIKDASPEEAVDVFVAAVKGVVELALPEDQMQSRIAILTAILFRTMPTKATTIARLIAQKLSQDNQPIEILPVIAAAAAIVMGNQAANVTAAFVQELSGDIAKSVAMAGAHPETVLLPNVVVALGLSVPHSRHASGRAATAMPLAPPIRDYVGSESPESEEDPTATEQKPSAPPPPAPPRPPTDRYAGQ